MFSSEQFQCIKYPVALSAVVKGMTLSTIVIHVSEEIIVYLFLLRNVIPVTSQLLLNI